MVVHLAAERTALLELAGTTVTLTARTLVLTRRLGRARWEAVVDRSAAGALLLVEEEHGWRVELELDAFENLRLGTVPMARVEAEWVVAVLAARWPELAERVRRVKETGAD